MNEGKMKSNPESFGPLSTSAAPFAFESSALVFLRVLRVSIFLSLGLRPYPYAPE